MSPLQFPASTIEYYLYHWVYFPSIFPHPYSLVSLIVLFAVGLALLFKGNYSWNAIFGALGAYFGFVLGHYVATVVSIGPVPPILASIAGAVIGAILMIFLVRVALPLGISYTAYLAVQTVYPGHLITGGIVFLAVLIATLVLYKKIVIGIAGVIGAFLVWFTFINFGIPRTTAVIISAIMLGLGLFLQLNEKNESRKGKKTMKPFDQDTKWD